MSGRTRMWEAVAAAGRLDDLAGWALAHAPAAAAVYSDGRERVVVVDPTGAGPGEPPGDLLARPPHGWDFAVLRRPVAGTPG